MKEITIPEAAQLVCEQLPRGGVFLCFEYALAPLDRLC